MSILSLYYSRTGNTSKVAREISDLLDCDLEEIIDLKNRNGIIGSISAIIDAVFRRKTKIKPLEEELSNYDLVIIGTPIWAGTMAPAIRTFIHKYKDKITSVALFTTSMKDKNVIKQMEKLSGKEVTSKMEILESELKSSESTEKIKEFIENIIN